MTLVSEESWPEFFSPGRLSQFSLTTDIWGKNPSVFLQRWSGPAAGPCCEVVMQSRWANNFHFIDHQLLAQILLHYPWLPRSYITCYIGGERGYRLRNQMDGQCLLLKLFLAGKNFLPAVETLTQRGPVLICFFPFDKHHYPRSERHMETEEEQGKQKNQEIWETVERGSMKHKDLLKVRNMARGTKGKKEEKTREKCY